MPRALVWLTIPLAGVTLLAQAPPQGTTAPAQSQGTPPAQQAQVPVFRGGVDLIRLDVSVLDRNRKPVSGLAADDFTVLEDGKAQRIVAVSEIVAAEQDPTPSAWMRHVTPDIAANDLTDLGGDGRFVAVVMDDWNIPWDDHEMILSAREVGRYVIDQLSPSDVGAVVFAQQPGKTQDFTTDRQKLIAAVDRFDPKEVRYIEPTPTSRGAGGADMPFRTSPTLMRSQCQRSQPTVPTLGTVVSRLSAIPNRRKTVVLVSVGLPLSFGGARGCAAELEDIMEDVYRDAQRSNVNIYAVDPGGLGGYERYLQTPVRKGRPAERVLPQRQAEREARARREFLHITADQTGARAIVNTNELAEGVDQMLAEAGTYYLVGYQTSNGAPDGKFRRLEVKVKRPDATVRTRSGFYAPKGGRVSDAEKPSSPGSNELGLTGMARGAALALRAQAVAIGRAGEGRDADVALALGVRLPASTVPTPEALTLVRVVYDAQDRPGPPSQERRSLIIPAGGADDLRYEVFQRITLAPGRWQVRLNATSTALDTSGTVYADIEVPDFSRNALSSSGLVLGRRADAPRDDALTGIVPIVPTTAREFSSAEEIVAFLRVFQGGAGPVVPVTVAAQLLNVSDEVVWNTEVVLVPDRFAEMRSAAVELALPLATLKRGAHMLTVSAALPDGTRTRTETVFRVK